MAAVQLLNRDVNQPIISDRNQPHNKNIPVMHLSSLQLRERAYSSMNYSDYCKTMQASSPHLRPLEAPTVPPPILLNSKSDEVPDDDQIVVKLLKDHAAKQEKEIKRLKDELYHARMQLEELRLKFAEVDMPRKGSTSLLEEAMRGRSRSGSAVD